MNEITQLAEKIKALLLNKVTGLRWNYFDIQIEAIPLNANELPTVDWFQQIVPTSAGWQWIGSAEAGSSSEIMRQLINAINQQPKLMFDAIEEIYRGKDIENESDAGEGTMGSLNRRNSEWRNEHFHKKIKEGFRENKDNMVVLAEGDSWFLFPEISLPHIPIKDFVKDIGDHLSAREDVAWYNIAYAGDWLSNMLYEGRYILELDMVEPHVFLISGGGNDMVGGKRIKNFVKAAQPEAPTMDSTLLQQLHSIRKTGENHATFDPAKYELGLSWINERFICFLNCIYIQYISLFVRVYKNTDKFKDLLTITQGYDYAIPSHDNTRFTELAHKAVNLFVGNGKWLIEPMEEKGIRKAEVQQAIMYVMIYEFNELMLDFARTKRFPNVAHIDSRGIARSKDDWFDELHLESEVFQKVADKFYACMKHFKQNGKLDQSVW